MRTVKMMRMGLWLWRPWRYRCQFRLEYWTDIAANLGPNTECWQHASKRLLRTLVLEDSTRLSSKKRLGWERAAFAASDVSGGRRACGESACGKSKSEHAGATSHLTALCCSRPQSTLKDLGGGSGLFFTLFTERPNIWQICILQGFQHCMNSKL